MHVYDWFVDNKLPVHSGGNKIKLILFRRDKNSPDLNISCDKNRIKQCHMVEYLDSYLEANMSGEYLAIKSRRKINAKLQLLYR